MKSASALQIISDTKKLREAWCKISKRNKLSKGSDNVTIKAFSSDLDSNLKIISSEIRSGNYRFSKLRPAIVAKSGSAKPRPIQIPAIRDRIVMKALVLHIQPSFAKFDMPCSFAFIAGKDSGVKAAIRKIQSLVNNGYKYYFEADIKNFFGAVNRLKLWEMFAKKIREKSLLLLLEKCFNLELDDLKSYQTEHHNIFLGAKEGIPQGGVLSPMLANFYLHGFDKILTAKGYNLIRYADDFVVMCKTLEEAKEAHILCKATLNELGLEIHSLDEPQTKSRFGDFSKNGLTFLGVRFEGQITYPDNKVVARFKIKVSDIFKSPLSDTLLTRLQGLANLIKGWGMGYKNMRVTKLYAELDIFIRNEVFEYLKYAGIHLRGKNRGKQMRFLGIPSLSAMVAYTAVTN